MSGNDGTPTDGYEVGYKKPPKGSRFKKGRSGNPKGRPKGTLNMATVLERILREKVVINQNGKRREVTKLEAALMQVTNKAVSGDLAAGRQLMGLVANAALGKRDAALPDPLVNELDREVMQQILRQYQSILGEEDSDNGSA